MIYILSQSLVGFLKAFYTNWYFKSFAYRENNMHYFSEVLKVKIPFWYFWGYFVWRNHFTTIIWYYQIYKILQKRCWFAQWWLCAQLDRSRFNAWQSSGFRNAKLSTQHKSWYEVECSITHWTCFFAKRLLCGRISPRFIILFLVFVWSYSPYKMKNKSTYECSKNIVPV